MTWPDRQGRARVHRVLQRGPHTRWPRQRFSRPQALCHVWTVRGFDIRLAWPLPGVHSEHPLACDPSGGEAQGESRVGPPNADATPSLRGGRVVGPGRKGAWRDSRRPPSKGLGRATAYLRTSGSRMRRSLGRWWWLLAPLRIAWRGMAAPGICEFMVKIAVRTPTQRAPAEELRKTGASRSGNLFQLFAVSSTDRHRCWRHREGRLERGRSQPQAAPALPAQGRQGCSAPEVLGPSELGPYPCLAHGLTAGACDQGLPDIR